MARASGTGGKTKAAPTRKKRTVKGRNPAKPKRPVARTVVRAKRSSVSPLGKELNEAREQQAATAEILKVIAASPGDVQPVLEAVAVQTNRLVGGFTTVVWRILEDVAHLAAYTHADPLADAALKAAAFRRPLSSWQIGATIRRGQVFSVEDTERDVRSLRDLARVRGFRSVLYVPMMHNLEPIGVIGVTRSTPGKFADHHVKLLQTFADQAVIAIENSRLFNETREALERQTATADILKVIASSRDDVQPVFDAIAERSNRLIGGSSTAVFSVVDDMLHLMSFTSVSPAGDAALKAVTDMPLSTYPVADAIRKHEVSQIADTEAEGMPTFLRDVARQRGWRSALTVPMVREGELVGVIGVTRSKPGKFADHHVKLLQTFADQAVIAIQNVRLFDEVQAKTRDLTESLDQQIATGEVLKAISHSAFDLQPVFDAIAENSVKLCHAERAFIFRFDGHFLRAVSSYNVGPEVKQFVDQNPIALGRHSISARAGVEQRTVHVADVHADPEYAYAVRDVDLIRTILAVPMLKSDELVGVITIYRLEVKPFTDKQVSLVETFAAQAVIAVENTRLINELRQSLDDLRAAQDRLVQTEKLASLGQLTAGIAHEIKNPLNFVNNFAALSAELTGELKDVLKQETLTDRGRDELDELTGILQDNLGKVVQHGKRADSIVKNMLLHSREGSGERRSAEINRLVEESLNLAYHGARAEKAGFSITLEHDLDPEADAIDLYPQEITRALLNLISNGFYAATKRKAEAPDGEFEPVLSAATRNLGQTVEIRIRDNGTGIPPEVREKMFNPFFTTKPTGEGTGLGLSMTHDIIVKQHGGKIDVETEPGVFTEFIITLPRKGSAPP